MNNFIQEAIRTESGQFHCADSKDRRLLHAGVGLVTEAAEFLDVCKKHIFYGKDYDFINMKEELGDLLWYMAIALDVLGSDFQTEMARVIAKLKVRYPERFTEHEAVYRSLELERKCLETDMPLEGKE